jgi:hypothetical protein
LAAISQQLTARLLDSVDSGSSEPVAPEWNLTIDDLIGRHRKNAQMVIRPCS